MNNELTRFFTIAISGLIAISAITGGLAILAGAEDFPLAWLEGSIFKSYTIPALILTIIVGGSALIATILYVKKHRLANKALIAAGAILMGQIIGEIIILNQEPPVPTGIEIFYFVLGLIVLILGAYFDRKTTN